MEVAFLLYIQDIHTVGEYSDRASFFRCKVSSLDSKKTNAFSQVISEMCLRSIEVKVRYIYGFSYNIPLVSAKKNLSTQAIATNQQQIP